MRHCSPSESGHHCQSRPYLLPCCHNRTTHTCPQLPCRKKLPAASLRREVWRFALHQGSASASRERAGLDAIRYDSRVARLLSIGQRQQHMACGGALWPLGRTHGLVGVQRSDDHHHLTRRAGPGVRSVIAVSRAAVSDTRTAWLWGVGNPVFRLGAVVEASSTNPQPEARLQ